MALHDEHDSYRSAARRESDEWTRSREHENHGRSKFSPSGNDQDFGADAQERRRDESYGRGPGSSAGLANVSDFDHQNESPADRGAHALQRDPEYHHWRQEQIRGFDNDYEAYREERSARFASEFEAWRKSRS